VIRIQCESHFNGSVSAVRSMILSWIIIIVIIIIIIIISHFICLYFQLIVAGT
jgi:t-SNARE complex subunit (syntaxin)